MMNSFLEKVVVKHTKLCENTLNYAFIDKRKYRDVLDKIANTELRIQSKYEFEKGITKLMEFDFQKLKPESYGKIYCFEENGVEKPAVYDLLCELLLHTDLDARYKCFYEITNGYYDKVLSRRGVTKDQFKMQVRLFLPYAKIERLFQCLPEDIQKAALDVEESMLYPELSREECGIILKNIYKSAEATLIRFDVIPAQELPGNLGRYFKVKLIVDNDGKTQTHHLFAKLLETEDLIVSDISRIPFQKERLFFGTISKSLEKLGLHKLTDVFPRCYFVRNDMLMFNDVTMTGHDSWDIHIPVSYKWLVTTVKILAKLHATSIILEEKLSENRGKMVRIDEEYPDAVLEGMFSNDEISEKMRESASRCIYGYLLSKFPHLFSMMNQNALTGRIKHACSRLYEILQKSDTIRNVLNHGDMWGANIMYKEDEDSGAASAYLIDFQLIRYCPPSVDLMFLIYVNTDRPTRIEHMTDLIELYYRELTLILRSHDVDVDSIFTFGQLVESCRDVEAAIICKSLIYTQFMLLPKQYKQEMMSDAERAGNFLTGDRGIELEKVWSYQPLRKRMEWLMEDLVTICESEI